MPVQALWDRACLLVYTVDLHIFSVLNLKQASYKILETASLE